MGANCATATGVEGIFRLSGSEKRIKELKQIFDSPDRFGKGLVWDGYTVHDAANVLRRYLNDLPEPVVPLNLYEKFRDPLRGATKHQAGDIDGPQFVDNFDEAGAIDKYQKLITELPPLNKQLLLYILDLLAVFAAKSDENRMTSQNLAAIFQPGMLSHPSHAMAPEEYRLNQCVLIFLIENQDHFLIGMQGTAADEKTKKEVESGTPTTPNTKVGVTRSDSTASAGAHSVRREGQVRRNRSVSSKHSRGEGSVGSQSPTVAGAAGGGLGRSNTVPSKKSPALAGGKFRRTDSPGHHSPSRVEPMTPVRQVNAPAESEESSPAVVAARDLPAETVQESGPSQERLLSVPQDPSSPPTKERTLPSLFQRSPNDGGDKRQPNKLKKKRAPGTMNISAHSSNASLPRSNAVSPVGEAANPLESAQPVPVPTADHSRVETAADNSVTVAAKDIVGTALGQATAVPSTIAGDSSQAEDKTQDKTGAAAAAPLASDDAAEAAAQAEGSEREKKKRWRLSRMKKDDDASSGSLPMPPAIGSNDRADASSTTIDSVASKPRRSTTQERPEASLTETSGSQETGKEGNGKDSNGKEEGKGPLGWIKHKYREAKENAESRRAKSPPADRPAEDPIASSVKDEDRGKTAAEDEKTPITGATKVEEAAQPNEGAPKAADKPLETITEPDTTSEAVASTSRPNATEMPAEKATTESSEPTQVAPELVVETVEPLSTSAEAAKQY